MNDEPRVSLYRSNESWDGIESSWSRARNFWRDQPTSVSNAGIREIYFLSEVKDEIGLADKNLQELPLAAKRPFTSQMGMFLRIFTFFLPATLSKAIVADLIGGFARLIVQQIRKWRRRGPTLA